MRRASVSSNCQRLTRKVTYPFFFRNQIKQFTACCIFKHNKDVRGCVNVFKVFDDVRMIKSSEHLDLTFNFFKNPLLFNVLLVQNFDGHFVVCNFVVSHCNEISFC